MLVDHSLGGLTRVSDRNLRPSFLLNLHAENISCHRVTRQEHEFVRLLMLLLLVLDLLLALNVLDVLAHPSSFATIMRGRMSLSNGTYRARRVYPCLTKLDKLSSSSMKASIVHAFLSRFVLVVVPVFLLKIWDVSTPVFSSWSKMTRMR